MPNNLAPIVVFAYNRPDHLQKTLQALAKNDLAKESVVFILCDGPKLTATETQKIKIEETKQVAKDKLWQQCFKKVFVVEQENNIGLRTSIISGATKVINEYGKVIVVEDDLETSPYFLKYMNEALDKYESYRGVFSISAQSYQDPNDFPQDYPYDVYAYPTHLPTGWATWADRWALVDWNIDKQLGKLMEEQPYMRNAFMRGGYDLYYRSLKERLNGLDVWSVCFSLAHFKHHAVSILPIVSYIHNIGFDGSGSNSGMQLTSSLNHNYFVNAKRNIRFMDVVYEDSRIMNMLYSSTVLKPRPWYLKIINRIGCKLTGKTEFVPKGYIYKT